MKRSRLRAHLVVLNATTSRLGSVTSLLGVDYRHVVPADAEFPRRIGRMDVFVRFFTWRCVPETLAVEVWQLNPDGSDRARLFTHHGEVPFDANASVTDHVFRLPNVEVPAEGVYAVRVCRLAQSRIARLQWKRLRQDYFRVVRAS